MKLKNKSGQTAIFAFMMGIVFFILGMALSPVLNDVVQGDEVNGVNGLNCSNPDISNQDKAYCTQTDLMPPVLLGIIFGMGGLLLGRLMI